MARRKFFLWLTLGLILLLGGPPAMADTPLTLKQSWAGNINYVGTQKTLRTAPNTTDPCLWVGAGATTSASISGIPASATITAAYLYWAGSGATPDYTVTFEGAPVTASGQYTSTSVGYRFFSGVADVTSAVVAKRNGSYSLTDLTIDNTNNNDSYCSVQAVLGGWALLVIYSDSSETFRVVNLYEGFQYYQNSSITLTLSNFMTPTPIGATTGKASHISWEGDPTLSGGGEDLTFQGTALSDANNPSGNQFNSVSNIASTSPSTGAVDNAAYGVDFDAYVLDSTKLTAGMTSATTVYSSGSDLVLLSAEIISVPNVPVADLAITMGYSGTMAPGQTVTYTLNVSNNGPNTETGPITVTNTPPAGLTYTGASGSGWVCNAPYTTCTRAGSLASGAAAAAITLMASVDAGASGTITNTAAVAGTLFDNVAGNNTASDSRPVQIADLSLLMARGGPLVAGATVAYTLTVGNGGPLAHSGTVTVVDTLPAGLTYASATGTGWSCSSVGQTVTCSSSTAINSGASAAALTINVAVDAGASGTLTNSATVTGSILDSNSANNTATDSGTVVANGCSTSTVGGGTVVTCTGDGSVTIPNGVTSVRYLVVGGGGGGGGIVSGNAEGAGGGGAGGVLSGTSFAVTAGATYGVTIGSGGTAGTGSVKGGNGGNSTFSSLTANGGGGGAWAGNTTGTTGSNGASGGGGSDGNNGGSGNQGNTGGSGNNDDGGGGGGGAGAAGGGGTSSTGGNGGVGVANDISGSSTYYGGGGGGGTDDGTSGTGGTGGLGGGGSAPSARGAGTAGTANTGGGGGGASGSGSGSAFNGGTGGAGIVIIRYAIPCTTSTVGGDTVVTCISSDSITIPAGVSSLRYLVVGGGGGGGGIGTGDEQGAGGGGAGGVLSGTGFAVTPGSFAVVVGGSGAGGDGSNDGSNGGNSSFSTITATGGGGGARETDRDGSAGGSGGGGSGSGVGGSGTGGQGSNGGAGDGSGGTQGGAGGGGGASAVGGSGSGTAGGNGGAGVADDISGISTSYGGGGGGGGYGAAGGSGGTGGGGSAPALRGAGTAGAVNTGGGGGGATGSASGPGAAVRGGAGGSGVVIVRYATPATGPNHYAISHSGTALTCEAEPVTITGHDSAHARISAAGKTISLTTSSAKGTWSTAADNCTRTCYDATNTVVACSGTFAATGSNAGTATYLFAGGEAAVRLCLKHSATGTVSVNVTDGTATEASGTAATETSPGADPGLVLSDTGLRFYASDEVDTLGNLVAGLRSDVTDASYQPSPQTLTIRALKSSETSPARCVSLLGGAPVSKTIQFAYRCIDPDTCHASSGGLEVNGTAVAGSGSVPTPASNVTVAFNASGYGSINLKYWDVGQIKLYALGSIADPATNDTVAIATGASNSFLVKPYGFSVKACTSATPCTVTNAADTDGTGTVFSAAGATFKATIKALAYGGSVVTPSFGLGTAKGTESVGLSRTLAAPSGGGTGTLGGTIAILRSSFSDGVASVSDLTWNEVGVITLSATNSTFEGTALSPAATGTSGNVGRFAPDHFETVVTGPMSCGALPFVPACPTGGLVYSGQAFTAQVTAYALGGSGASGVTTNYAGSFARLVTLGAWDAVGSTTQQNPPAGGGATAFNPTVAAVSFTAGVATTATPAYTFAIPTTSATPPTAPTNIYIRAIDADTPAVSSLRTTNPLTTSIEGGVKVVNGRLRMANAYGSERLPLVVPAEVQYYDGTNWLTNTQDSSSPPLPWAVSPSVSSALVGTGSTTPTLGASLASGLAALSASAPGAGAFGYLNLTVTVPSYLKFRWAGCAVAAACVAGDFVDPTSRVTFGIYKGNNRIIYRRERY